MKYKVDMIEILRNVLPPVFSSNEAVDILGKRYKAPLKALGKLVSRGELLRLKRGWFAFADNYIPFLCACRIHGPSYVSFETALGFYGLIPERVEEILCVVDGRPLQFSTKWGRYTYHSQHRQLFAAGMDMRDLDGYLVPIASPEKALLDTIARARLHGSRLCADDLGFFVLEDLRIENDDLKKLSLPSLRLLSLQYRNLAPQKLLEYLEEI